MDFEKFLRSLSDKIVLPILMLVVLGLSYLAFSANNQLRNIRVEFTKLNTRFEALQSGQTYVGTKIPGELLAIISSKVNASNNLEIKYFLLQFISMQACTPCTEEDINTCRKISAASEKCLLFFVVSDTGHRELDTLKTFFGIDFPVQFIFYDATPKLFLDSSMLLTLTDGTILLKSSSTPTDTLLKTLSRKILLQFANS